MYDNHKYSKLVFYLEACESGSMFNKLLPKNINIFATTASNPTESSYACYYDSKRQTYLVQQEYGDLSIGNLPLTQFQGSKNSFHQLIGGDEVTPAVFTTVDSGDVPIHVLKNRIQATTDPEDKKL
ncbi:unnamed protein product [Oppiella nova]|uniref:Legumain n=1 Tax=Oppiella nova TaxID=334625 RepID=A0A7R9QZG1_9ACAR|nr:unnamed protein product [Oppiella nova]CAG2180550.1 unnamed protein product [Oppiella nova]